MSDIGVKWIGTPNDMGIDGAIPKTNIAIID